MNKAAANICAQVSVESFTFVFLGGVPSWAGWGGSRTIWGMQGLPQQLQPSVPTNYTGGPSVPTLTRAWNHL